MLYFGVNALPDNLLNSFVIANEIEEITFMKNYLISNCFILVLMMTLLTSCGNETANTVIEMELTQNHDTAEPLKHEKRFCVSENIDNLSLEVAFEMKGESGLLEIADVETGKVFWSDAWEGEIGKTSFSILLKSLEKEREYVIRFTGTKITHTKIVIASESKLVKECEQPAKPNRG